MERVSFYVGRRRIPAHRVDLSHVSPQNLVAGDVVKLDGRLSVVEQSLTYHGGSYRSLHVDLNLPVVRRAS